MGLIAVLVMPSIVDSLNKSKETSYKVLINNIKVAAETYYEECEYGDLSSTTEYGDYACEIKEDSITNETYIETTIGALAGTGFLKVTDTKEIDGTEVKIVLNPKNNVDMSECEIKIAKVKEEKTDENRIKNIKVTYKVTAESGSDCPTTEEYEGVVK